MEIEKLGKGEARKERLFLGFGLAVGLIWFIYNRRVDFGPYPVAADAVTYANLADSFSTFGAALSYSGDRTFGFPLVLYLIKRASECFGPLSGDVLNAIQSSCLLGFHFISSWFFYRQVRDFWVEKFGEPLHPVALLLLLIHPGLVSHTSVLLTDTFATDLLMIGTILFLGARTGTIRSLILRGVGVGVTLGMALGTRPFLIAGIGLASLFIFGLAIIAKENIRRLFTFFLPLILGTVIVLLPSVLSCRAQFGQACQQDPKFTSRSVAFSLQAGLTSYRTYWSIRSPSSSTAVNPDDPFLKKTLESACDVLSITGPVPWIGCLSSRPWIVPIYAMKKLIAIFDSFFLQPYASDASPEWTIKYNRIFSAIAFTGYFFAIGVLFIFLRRRDFWGFLAFVIPVTCLLVQIPMHVEGRYSFTAIPVSVVSLVWFFQSVQKRGMRQATIGCVLAVLLVALFMGQTHAWDQNDFVLLQIEGHDR